MTKEEALMMAIEALDNADYHRADEAIVIIKEALAQREQLQPVWSGGPTNKDYEDAMRLRRINELAAPPQRTWVGLSDKELNVIGSQWHFNLLGKDDKADLFAFAQAIETALKEKNA